MSMNAQRSCDTCVHARFCNHVSPDACDDYLSEDDVVGL